MTQNLKYVWVALALLAACSSPTRLQNAHYVHLIYQHPAAAKSAGNTLTLIFIEGDGVPWVAHGTRIAQDPTPFHALAYNLYKATSQASWYITRPCYNHVRDPRCTPVDWTDARYSEDVVTSMVEAVNANLAMHPAQKLVLVGYSGGGTLAVLMAPRIPQVAGIITIAGNLDTSAWTMLHGYQPLAASLNPAETTELNIPHLAMMGGLDTNIPLSSVAGYLQTHPHTLVQRFPQYDHVCCWEKNWPALLRAALADMKIDSP